MPTVSVIIPTYNSAALITDAIDSVLAQTYKDYEIIVVDDGSTDNTREVVRSYGNRIQYIYQENSHIAAARNNGFKASSGKYIANLDADDLWLPEKLKKQITLLEKHPEAGLVYCDGYIRTIGKENLPEHRISELYPPQKSGSVFSYVFKANPIPSSSTIIPRAVWEKVGGLDPTVSLREGQDYEFFARISAFAPVYACPEPLMVYRRHEKNTSSVITPTVVRQRINIKLHARHMVLKNLAKTNIKLPCSILLFQKMPKSVQYGMLLWWRFIYGSSLSYTFKALMKFGSKLLLSLMGRK
jgi:glycosyltransferase involved in cell wall biosynthesis